MGSRNWAPKRRKRRLRKEVAARFTEACMLSRIGHVTVDDPNPRLMHYTPEGVIYFDGKLDPWLNRSEYELRYLLEVDLYPVEPIPALELLARQIKED